MENHLKKKSTIFLTILTIIFLLGILISIYYISKWYIENKSNKKLEERLSATIQLEEDIITNEKIYNVDFNELKKLNNDVIGWLKVNNTNIEYAVLKTSNNKYYLNHNFEKQFNTAGWIFADYKNKFDGTDKNIVIYGHNRKDNSMFGSLKNVLTEEWYSNEQNLVIDFIIEKDCQKYKVFSIYKIKNENFYIDTEFKNNEFENFIKILKNRSIKNFNIDISNEDNILTLSTCDDNNKYRVVLHAVKIKQSE